MHYAFFIKCLPNRTTNCRGRSLPWSGLAHHLRGTPGLHLSAWGPSLEEECSHQSRGAWRGSVIPLAGTLGYRSLGGSGIGTKHVTLGEVKPQARGPSTPSSASPLGPQGMGASHPQSACSSWPWAGSESLLLFSHTEKEQDAKWMMRAGVLLSQPSSQDPLPGTCQEYMSRRSYPGSEQALLGRLLPERRPHSLGEWLLKVAGKGWGVYEILRLKM